MARTRGEIKTLIEAHTGRTKDTLENSLCDSALKFAVMRHHFKDAQSQPSDISITEDAASVDISSISGLMNIVTARIVEADGSRNKILPLKTRGWWDEKVINPEDNGKGWPAYGMRWGSTILLDRPADSGLELRLRVTTDQTFTDDTTECPISVLDLFVEHYATAHVFKNIKEWDAYGEWMKTAVGLRYLIDGTIGGELMNAVEADGVGDLAVEIKAEPHDAPMGGGGVSVENLIDGHGDYGHTRSWFR